MTVLVKKLGGSVAIVIPKAVAKGMDLVVGTALEISSDSTGITLRKRGLRPRRSMARLVADINSSRYRRRNSELSSDGPIGKEIG